MPAELWKLASNAGRDLCREISPLRQEGNQRLAVRAGGSGHEVTVAEQYATNPSRIFEREGSSVTCAHDPGEGADGITFAERGRNIELRRFTAYFRGCRSRGDVGRAIAHWPRGWRHGRQRTLSVRVPCTHAGRHVGDRAMCGDAGQGARRTAEDRLVACGTR